MLDPDYGVSVIDIDPDILNGVLAMPTVPADPMCNV
jgi:hypothetical protein